MGNKFYVFREFGDGTGAVFDSKEKLDAFFTKYANVMYQTHGDFPTSHDDYEIQEFELNPDFTKWWEGED